VSNIYTVGFQPIEMVPRADTVIDVMNTVMNAGVPTGNLRKDVIEYIKTIKLQPGDKFMLNTPKNKFIIPYVWEELNRNDAMQNLIVYDPSYAASESEIYKILQNMRLQLRGTPEVRPYLDTVNSIRDIISRNKDNMPQKEYFNVLTLLSDANRGNAGPLIDHVMQFNKPWQVNMTKKAVFFGDPVDPRYFEYLNSQGVFVVAFLPYDAFTTPCMSVDDYYFTNPFFQSQLYTLIELRRLVQFYFADMIIMNPGGIYLDQQDTEFYSCKLSNDVKIHVLPGTYTGAQIQI